MKNKTLSETELQTAVAGFTARELEIGKIVGDAVVECIRTRSGINSVTQACIDAWFMGGEWRYIRGGIALQNHLNKSLANPSTAS